MKYRLPILAYDVIIYSGLHYVGRDALLITSSDAVVSIGGRLGTLHEFTIAIESGTPIGFLQGAGGISDQVETLMELARPLPPGSMVTFNRSAPDLIKDLTDYLDKDYSKYHNLYQ